MPESPIATALPSEDLASLRGRVGQGVDAIAGSANKVILGVVDSSFGVLRAFLPGQTMVYGGGSGAAPGSALFAVPVPAAAMGTATGGETDAALWGVRPSLGLLRRDTGFSIAGLTAALPGGPGKAKSHPEEEGQRELVEVSSRPPSCRSGHEGSGSEETEGSSEDDSEESEDEEGQEDGEDEGQEGEQEEQEQEAHDTRSIKSFESMLSSARTTRKKTSASAAPGSSRRRKRLTDLTDRLTHGMAGVSRRVQGGDAQRAPTLSGRLPPPNRRFVECTEQDIRVSEVGELLREYQRLAEAVRSAGGFQE